MNNLSHILIAESDWRYIKFLKPDEFGKNWGNMDFRAIKLLDEMRQVIGKPIIIHSAYDISGHIEDSQHGKIPCTAIDFHIDGLGLLDQLLFAERFPWTGIGVYPHWNNPGLHCDLRLISEICLEQAGSGVDFKRYKGARWLRDDKTYEKVTYLQLSEYNLKAVGAI